MELSLGGGQVVRFADGGRSHDPTLPAVVLIHGAGMNRTVWQLQTRFLAHHGYRVAALDLPGHGGSTGPALQSIGEMADWLSTTIARLGLGPAHLVGHSMGTYVAIEAAAAYPEMVRSLVLIGTAASMPVHPELLDAAVSDVARAGRLMTSWAFGPRAHVGHHATPGMWLLGGSTALIDISPRGSLGADLRACNVYRDAVATAASVECPVALVLGTDDKMTPVRRVEALTKAFGECRTTILEGAGHMLPLEAPDATRAAIVEALETARG